LIYVAVTRAKETLVEVSGATETYDKKSAEEEAA
jgi:superfamily I DNA/RNA helicase